MLQKTECIVLHTVRYKDTALMATVYSEASGRASLVVPVSRGRRSAVRSVLFQPPSLVELEADVRPNQSVGRVKEARTAHPYASLPYDPRKAAIVLFLSEFLYRALREETENRPLFAYLRSSLLWLDECRTGFANFHLVFLMRLSRFLGLYPNLEGYAEGDWFDLRAACFTSRRPAAHNDCLAPAEAARMACLMRMDYATMHLFRLSRDERARCLDVILAYYRLHLPDFPELRSVEVLRELFD